MLIGCFDGKEFPIQTTSSTAIEEENASSTPVILHEAISLSNTSVKVVFNKSVQKDSAENYENYSIDGLVIIFAELNKDNPEIVNLTTTPQEDKEYSVIATNIIDINDLTIDTEHNKVNFTGIPQKYDTTCPTLLQAEAIHATLVRLTFSEPMDTNTLSDLSAYSIDKISINQVQTTSNPTTVLLYTDSQLPIEYTLTVTKVKDASENEICNSNTAKFSGTTVTDDVSPTIEKVEVQDNSSVLVTFSEAIDPITAENIANYTINGLTVISAVIIDANSKQVLLFTSSQSAIEYTLTVSNVKDKSNNIIAIPNSGIFQGISGGTPTPPIMISVTPIYNTKLIVTFSKPVTTASSETVANYAIPSLTNSTATRDSASPAKVNLVTSSQSAITYTLTANNIYSENNILIGSPNSKTFTGDALPCISTISTPDNISIKVQFTEKLNLTEANNISNYSEIGSSLTLNSISVDSFDNSIVYISSATQTAGVTYTLQAMGLKDLNGNLIDTTNNSCYQKSFSGSAVGDTVVPTVTSVIVISPTTIIIIFSEIVDLTTSQTASNYVISPSVSVTNAVRDASDKSKVTLTTAAMDQINYTITISGVKDLAGNPSNDTKNFTGDGFPKLNTATATDNTHVELVFSETVDITSAETTGNYSIPGLTVFSATRKVGEPNKVTLQTSSQTNAQNYTVTVTNVKDLTNNIIQAPNNTANFVGFNDTQPPKVISATSINNTTVEVAFDEAVQQATAETSTNYVISGLPVISAVRQVDTSKVRLTTHYQSNTTYTVTVSNVQDLFSHTITAPDNTANFNGSGSTPDFINDFGSMTNISELIALGWLIHDHSQATNDAPSQWKITSGSVVQLKNIWGGSNSGTRTDAYEAGTYFIYNVDIGNDYFIQAKMSSADDDDIGLVVRYTDENHYYRFSWMLSGSVGGNRKLVLVNGPNAGGSTNLEIATGIPYVINQKYIVRLSVVGNLLEVYIDDVLIFSHTDNTLTTGKAGFYNWGNVGSYYDDVLIQPIP